MARGAMISAASSALNVDFILILVVLSVVDGWIVELMLITMSGFRRIYSQNLDKATNPVANPVVALNAKNARKLSENPGFFGMG
jgi:hypothetical protein